MGKKKIFLKKSWGEKKTCFKKKKWGRLERKKNIMVIKKKVRVEKKKLGRKKNIVVKKTQIRII